MKHDKLTKILCWSLLIFFILVIIIGLFVTIKLNYLDKFDNFFIDVCKFFIQTLIGTFLIGGCVKIISGKFIKVVKNDSALKKMGIQSIQPSKSTAKDEMDMFGCEELNDYPTEIGFMFITGCVFIEEFKEKIINAINHGTKVKILVAAYDVCNNKDSGFLERTDYFNSQDDCKFWKQISEKTIPVIKYIKSHTKENNSGGGIEVAFYNDEYRYNFRYAKYAYCKEKNGIKCGNKVLYKMWANIQPGIADAIDLSIALKGEYITEENGQEDKSTNLLYSEYLLFSRLWDKYKNPTEKRVIFKAQRWSNYVKTKQIRRF